MNAVMRLFSQLVVARRNKKAAAEKEARAQHCARELDRLNKRGLLPQGIAENILTYDADELILEHAFLTSPSD